MFRGFDMTEQPVPGDIVWRDGQLLEYSLADGWAVAERFMGEFNPDREYNAGDVATCGGFMWIYVPEQGDDLWRCIVPPPAWEATP
jgi:hypothetical protein